MSRYVPPHLRGKSGAGADANPPAAPLSSPPQRGGSGGAFGRTSESRDFARGGSSAFGGGHGYGDADHGPGGNQRFNSRWDDSGRERERSKGHGRPGGYRVMGGVETSASEAPGSASAWNKIRAQAANSGGASTSGLSRLAGGMQNRDSGFGGRNLDRNRDRDRDAPPPRPVPIPAAEKAQMSEEELKQAQDEREKAERERHPDMFSEETVALNAFYHENSAVFRKWSEVRSAGYTNKYISHFFDRKNHSKSQGKRGGAHVGADIRPIFSQFFKYAIDIDNGVAYTERAKDIAIAQGDCWFLDFGFAPGGMADLLLETHPDIKGVGVTLDPALGGNVYLDSLDSHDRFWPYIGDVIDMARDNLDLKAACKLPDNFTGFDFVIIGITIHQEWEGENMNELKDLLHFAQLFFAIKYLKPGGMVMMRMHMSVRLVDCHFLALMLSMFDLDKFTGLKVGRERLEEAAQKKALEEANPTPVKEEVAPAENTDSKPKSKLDQLCAKIETQTLDSNRKVKPHYAWENLGKTAVATKPFSTFSMRKTYWVLYHGFICSDELREEVLGRLQVVLGKDVFAYGFNAEKSCFNKPILLKEPIDELLGKYGKQMVSVLEDVWAKQVQSLEGFMIGLTDKFCRDGISCRRRQCNMAHKASDMIPEVLDALNAVDVRAKPRLAELGIAFGR